jgi:hypothetical protein
LNEVFHVFVEYNFHVRDKPNPPGRHLQAESDPARGLGGEDLANRRMQDNITTAGFGERKLFVSAGHAPRAAVSWRL